MKWMNDYKDALLCKAQYSGNKEPRQKRISASSLGDDILQNYYKYIYGVPEDENFGANSVGSVYQLGVDKALEGNGQYVSAHRFNAKLINGWEVSGEVDQYDIINNVIIDNKVTTITSIKKIKSKGKDHQYALQLGVYKWLMWKQGSITFNEPKCALSCIDKTASYFKPNKDSMHLIEIETYSVEEIEKMLLDRTNILQMYIDSGKEPHECADLFWFKSKGQNIKMRCLYYCAYASQCKHYNANVLDKF